MVASTDNLVVPMVLWGKHPPSHNITCLCLSHDMKSLVTGSEEGQVCLWKIDSDSQIYPWALLYGHSTKVLCIAQGSIEKHYTVSYSIDGELCLWDMEDGRCMDSRRTALQHTAIQSYKFGENKDVYLVCYGQYPEIHIMNPVTLEVIYSLVSHVHPDWISALCILRPNKREADVVLAVSNSGYIKMWTVTRGMIKTRQLYEDESKQIRCLDAQQLRCCPYNQRTVLIVCSKYWQAYNVIPECHSEIYDAGEFSLLCSENSRKGERWVCGEFITLDRVLVWSSAGTGYLYKLPTNANPDSADYHRVVGPQVLQVTPSIYCTLTVKDKKFHHSLPSFSYALTQNGHHLVFRGDSAGTIHMWQIPAANTSLYRLISQGDYTLPVITPKSSMSFTTLWKEADPPGILDDVSAFSHTDPAKITSTLYLAEFGRLVCGCSSGHLVMVPVLDTIKDLILSPSGPQPKRPHHRTFYGHRSAVTSLFYPRAEHRRYDLHLLLSGSADFSVILWDIAKGMALHRFTNHCGEVTQFYVPPPNCRPRVLPCICAVSTDHSVSLLSLKERKCLLMSSRHIFPVKCVKFRPKEDLLVIGLEDGTVAVYGMCSGHLDRILRGISAEESLRACDFLRGSESDHTMAPQLSLSQAFRRKNLATFRSLAQQKLSPFEGLSGKRQGGTTTEEEQDKLQPLLIQGIKSNPHDSEAHVILFDTEALIVHLLCEEFDLGNHLAGMPNPVATASTPAHMSDVERKFSEFITMVKGKAETVAEGLDAGASMSSVGSFTRSASTRLSNDPRAHARRMAEKLSAKGRRISTNSMVSGPRQHHLHHGSRGGPLSSTAGSEASMPRVSSTLSQSSSMGSTVFSEGSYPQLNNGDSTARGGSRKNRRDKYKLIAPRNVALKAARLLMSVLHAWTLDPDLDKLCTGKLSMLQPTKSLTYGLLSRDAHMMVMLPRPFSHVTKTVDPQPIHKGKVVSPYSVINTGPHTMIKGMSLEEELNGLEPTDVMAVRARRAHLWEITHSLTTQRLLSVIAVANTLMGMHRTSFADVEEREDELIANGYDEDLEAAASAASQQSSSSVSQSTIKWDLAEEAEGEGELESSGALQSQIKQSWSLLAAMYCVLLPDLIGPKCYLPPELEILASRWQDRCLEVREAAQALLLAELKRMGSEGRRHLILHWAPFMPCLVDEQNGKVVMAESAETSDMDEEERAMKKLSNEKARQQATAIVMLAVIGSEFGDEIEPSRWKSHHEERAGGAAEGFTLSNNSLAWSTSKALSYLLLSPSSCKLSPYAPLRRAATALIGRGFSVWEPYLDVSTVLLGLLDMCIGADSIVPNQSFGLPLSPMADACRTARHSLLLIATARPAVFLTQMAKEVARFNSSNANSSSTGGSGTGGGVPGGGTGGPGGSGGGAGVGHSLSHRVLLKAKSEILRLIDTLVEKLTPEVSDLLVEMMDVAIHCLDPSVVKMRGLSDAFPSIERFSMITYCQSSKRICVGSKSGTLAFYELKSSRSQTIPFQASPAQAMVFYLKPHSKETVPAHQGVVSTVCFSPDGKYLASFSALDCRVKVWQTASSSLFGIASHQTKLLRTYVVPPISTPVQNPLKAARFTWQGAKVIQIVRHDGSHSTFNMATPSASGVY